MNLLDFIFRLGVVFAIYGFLWGFFELGIRIISSGRQRTIGEVYIFRAFKYFFLVDVTFLFCLKSIHSDMVVVVQTVFAGLILLTYFIGKLQKNQKQSILFKFAGAGLPQKESGFHLKYEIPLIVGALMVFTLFWFYPLYASNPISIWFHESIIDIENTPVIGFIFKVIGFFFLLNLIFKMAGAIAFVLNGGKLSATNNNENNDDTTHFDDYTEVN
ncbi:MAG: hypothetical protein P8N52_07040 [Crocinitomicaceae bacterium]|nr:hypothetical protein [Crocinitomicaceae bacterium]MDG1776472.1 hypothetical protein [Crocinitomicaceae bacterium]